MHHNFNELYYTPTLCRTHEPRFESPNEACFRARNDHMFLREAQRADDSFSGDAWRAVAGIEWEKLLAGKKGTDYFTS